MVYKGLIYNLGMFYWCLKIGETRPLITFVMYMIEL